MRITSSYSQLMATTTNPYQNDKTQLLSALNSMSQALKKDDYKAAQSYLTQAQSLLGDTSSAQSNTLKAQLEQQLSGLETALKDKDKNATTKLISTIKDEVKTQKNLVLRHHSTEEILNTARSQFLFSAYA